MSHHIAAGSSPIAVTRRRSIKAVPPRAIRHFSCTLFCSLETGDVEFAKFCFRDPGGRCTWSEEENESSVVEGRIAGQSVASSKSPSSPRYEGAG